MRAAVSVVLASVGCGFLPGETAIDAADPGAIDANDTDAVDAPAVCTEWVARHFVPCEIPPPSPNDVVLAGDVFVYDTATAILKSETGAAIDHAQTVLTQPGGVDARLISVPSFVVAADATLHVVGPMPLIVASWTDISIAGIVDAGSSSDPVVPRDGAGARTAACNAAQQGTEAGAMTGQGGSGGGGGGGFGGPGGAGAIGDSPPIAPGGSGAIAISPPSVVRAGCFGAASGRANANATVPPGPDAVSAGGAGGGAIQLSARLSIAIDGTVSSGGAGGLGAPAGTACGGGGGGSGGYIGLDSASITTGGSAIFAVNGGGGGGTAPFVGSGVRGLDGRRDATAATGGPNNGCSVQVPLGGNGAPGSASGDLGGGNAVGNTSCGGGGGGGGAGYILYWGASFVPNASTTWSPLPSSGPPP